MNGRQFLHSYCFLLIVAALGMGLLLPLGCESKPRKSARPADNTAGSSGGRQQGTGGGAGNTSGSQAERPRDEMPTRNVGVHVQPNAVAPMQYFQVVIRSMALGEQKKALANLHAVGEALHMYAAVNDKMPASLDELVKSGMISREAIISPVKSKEGGSYEYVYIAGQSPSSPPDNVVVYDSKVLYAGKAVLLRMDGAAEAVSPETLEKAVAATQARMGK